MQIQVNRTRQGAESTLSEIYVDGQFICYGLEDAVRDVKEDGVTAIPAGIYALVLNRYGAMNGRYKKQFPALHHGMIEISNIPDSRMSISISATISAILPAAFWSATNISRTTTRTMCSESRPRPINAYIRCYGEPYPAMKPK